MIAERIVEPGCRSRLCSRRLPRTMPQAQALDDMLGDAPARLNHVILVK